jgi:translation initiation factor 2B subunit (eIF-2B alpha/beta/delta family)
MKTREELEAMVAPIRDDLMSGAAEIALQAITIFRSVLAESQTDDVKKLKQLLAETAKAVIKAQPAMAPLFHLGNTVLIAVQNAGTVDELKESCDEALEKFEKRLCESASIIADHVYELIPPGELVFAYSFSSTVVTSLMNARSQRKFFRVVCSESRPSLEGRKLAGVLAQAGVEVIHTFDSAMGLILPQCRAAFMGCDAVANPGIVNKVGSWLLALACRELGIPLYALAGTEKFVTDERLFEFEDFSRPGKEVWAEAPNGVRILNNQFELIPFSWIKGLVTEHGILQEKEIEQYVSKLEVHEALKLQSSFA